jgi:hypothetical protein
MNKPCLIITIDAEEGFDWNNPFRRDGYTVQNLFDHDFHMSGFYSAYNINPIMLLSYPLLNDTDCQRLLKKYITEKRYILGTHLHSWVTPPFTEELSEFNSFAHNMPAELEAQKLKILTDRFIDVLGFQPLCYKAGRYGISQRTFEFLYQLGYKYDFTPFAKCDFSDKHGPYFKHIDNTPFKPLGKKAFTCYPATADYVGYGRNNALFKKLFYNKIFIKAKGRSITSRLNLLSFIRLSPEGITEEEMKSLTRTLIKKGQKYFHLSYHSSSFSLQASPYAKNQDDIDLITTRLKNYIHFFQEIGGKIDVLEKDLNTIVPIPSMHNNYLHNNL